MNANGNGLKVVHGKRSQEISRLPTSRLQLIAAAVGLAVLLVGGAGKMTQRDSDRSNDAAAQPRAEVQLQTEPATLEYVPDSAERHADGANAAAAHAGSEAFVYFPAQYENQAKVKEEHIEAF